MVDDALVINKVSKTFKIDQRKGISKITKNKQSFSKLKTLKALDDISFQVKKRRNFRYNWT